MYPCQFKTLIFSFSFLFISSLFLNRVPRGGGKPAKLLVGFILRVGAYSGIFEHDKCELLLHQVRANINVLGDV